MHVRLQLKRRQIYSFFQKFLKPKAKDFKLPKRPVLVDSSGSCFGLCSLHNTKKENTEKVTMPSNIKI